MAVPVLAAAGWYMKELVKYPPQFKIGFISNNPPIYDLLPKVKGAIERLQEDREEKYPRHQ
jgi:arylsulfatase